MSPLISVVIPTRNRLPLLCRAIDSVLRQSYHHFEIVIVVDGKDPVTLAGLAKYNDVRIRIHELELSIGGSGARNEGVRLAEGEWVAFLDDDDEWYPEKLEKQLCVAQRLNSDFSLVASRFIARSPNCDFLWPKRLPTLTEPLSEYLFVRKSFFFGEGLLQTSTLFANKALLQKIPFTNGLKKHQDWDWVLRVASLDKFSLVVVPEALAVWYVEDARQTVSNNSTWRFSLEWIQQNRNLVTRKAYAAFIVTQVVPQASRQAEWKAFWPLLREIFHGGDPRILDVALFLVMWLIPQNLRRLVRGVLTKVKV